MPFERISGTLGIVNGEIFWPMVHNNVNIQYVYTLQGTARVPPLPLECFTNITNAHISAGATCEQYCSLSKHRLVPVRTEKSGAVTRTALYC